jgi:hypothetical protein
MDYLSYKKYFFKLHNLKQELTEESTIIEIPSKSIELFGETSAKRVNTTENIEQNENLCQIDREIIVSTDAIDSFPILIELFETQMQLAIYERDYLNICKFNNLKFIQYADVLINEFTGVVILDQSYDLDRLVYRLNYLKFQLDICYLIIFYVEETIELEAIKEQERLNLLIQLNKIDLLKIKLFEVYDYNQLKEIFIRMFSHDKNFSNKICLNVEPTIPEIILLSCCCFNSYSAHCMTINLDLNELLQLKCDIDIEAYHKSGSFCRVPLRMIKNFYKSLNKSRDEDINNNEIFESEANESQKLILSDYQSQTQSRSAYKLTYEKSRNDNTQTCLVFKKS